MRFKLISILLYVSASAFSQNVAVPPATPKADSLQSLYRNYAEDSVRGFHWTDNLVYPKSFQEGFREKYKTPDFDYSTTKPRESLWQKLQKRLIKLIQTIFGQTDPLKSATYVIYILRFLALAISAVVVYFLIRFLLGNSGNIFFGKRRGKFNITSQDIVENIHEINFAGKIADLEKTKDFRAAVRYHFLYVLKKMSDQKILRWTPEKTNKDYLAEINNSNLQKDFKELTYIFDYVWYGEFNVTENDYFSYRQKFLNFRIQTEKNTASSNE
ncbi:DUF4129 domain-containing protein [Kaistella palustris]|uniref:DUF4129 domain-containing protein n=1 Tax=Kaistella palustris TaxID=493376 RepID=UPI0004080DD2|nr:DUF4129 domain-containing protein [Kaistella palustris]